MTKDLRSQKAKARDKWFESDAGKSALDSGILFTPCYSKYLKNRIESAWCAGWDQAIKHYKKLKGEKV